MIVEKVQNGYILTHLDGSKDIADNERVMQIFACLWAGSLLKIEENKKYNIDIVVKNYKGEII